MKNIYILLILLLPVSFYAQTTYRVTISDLGYHFSGSKNFKKDTPHSIVVVRLKYSNSGDVDELFYHGSGYFHGRVCPYTYGTFNDVFLFYNKIPSQIEIQVFANRKQRKKYDADKTQRFNISGSCIGETKYNFSANRFNLKFNLKIEPVIKLVQPIENDITPDKPFNIVAPSGYPSSIYNWQYQLGSSTTWLTVPGTAGQSTMNKKPKDFLSGNDYIGKPIRFSLKYCDDNYSDPVNYHIIFGSPVLTSFRPTETQCSYSSDGSFTASFDRNLKTGEELFMTLYEIDGANEILIANKTATILGVGNTYSWPDPLTSGDYLVKYQSKINGVYSSLETSGQFTIDNAPVINFSATSQPTYCFGGSDGQIKLSASGGVGNFEYQVNGGAWTAFSNANSHTIFGLSAGTYTIKVRDGNQCTERLGNGSDKEVTITVTQPTEAVSLSLVSLQNTTANGFTNGSITVDVDGGTPFGDGSYTFEWRDSTNTVVTSTTTQNVASGYRITLNDIGADTYTLTVTDASYNTATTKTGCTFLESYTITEPPALSLSMQETGSISCNSSNTFDNPSSDGELTAIASGGVPFSPLINGFYAYIYTWKKKDASGVWQTIAGKTTNTLSNIDAGEYAVNIEDANGIIVGTYTNNILTTANDVEYTLTEPELLEVSLSKTDVFCHNGSDGTITSTITGGTGNYSVLWSTGATTQNLTNLTAGTYLVYVMDARGCEATGQVTVSQSGGLETSIVEQINPTCYLGNDGSISVSITGGQAPYTYLWNTGNTTTSLSNLTKGIYTVQITDANNCTTFINVELVDPDPIIVELGEDRTLCNGQAHLLDITIDDPNATYRWTSNNGFSSDSSSVSLTESGIYTATLTTGLGCVGTDTIEITTSAVDIDSQFLVTSQAFAQEEIVLVNTSNPFSAVVEWIIPNNAQIIQETNETITLLFDTPGAYNVTLRSFQGDCFQDDTKPVIIEKARDLPDIGDADAPFIVDFIAYPNPTTGVFEVTVTLQEEATISLRLFSLLSSIPLDDRQAHNASEYTLDYNVNLAAGVYVLLLETAKGSEIRKIIIE